jgi:guanylate kinase
MGKKVENKVVIITAPSGSGKTSLVKRMLESVPELSFSISACTREKRESEVDGKDYYFITEKNFKELIVADEFVEWEMVYKGKYYGTLKSDFDRIWSEGKFPIVDIDVEGALSIKKKYPNAITVFIKVPVEILRKRLEDRGTETPQSIEERVAKAIKETENENKFDLVIINEDLDIASNILLKELSKYIGK